MKRFLIFLLLAASYAAGQAAHTKLVGSCAGATLSAKLTACEASCTNQASCVTVITSDFSFIANESLPTPCSGCTRIDQRQPIPIGTVAGTVSAGNDERFDATEETFSPPLVKDVANNVTCNVSTDAALGCMSATDHAKLGTIPPAQVQTDWNASAGLGVLLNKPTIPAAQVQSDWNAGSGLGQILNKPTIPAAQIQTDWNAVSGLGQLLNKPTLGTLAAKSAVDYSTTDITNKPTLGTIASHATTEFAASNAATTVNGQTCTLGSTCTITAAAGQAAFLSADTGTSASNTLITTGMTFSIAANTKYTLDCNLIFSVSTTSGVGLTSGVNGPGTPTEVSLMRQINTTASAFRIDSSQGTAWAAKIGATATTVTGLSMAHLYGLIENGSTAGTLDIQYANIGTTGTTVIKRGSWCKLQ